MEQHPVEEATQEDLEVWFKAQAELTRVKELEMSLRMKIFKHRFPAPTEGTNSAPLADGYVLKAVHVVNRSVDEAALSTLKPVLIEQGFKVDSLIKWKPELKVGEYKKLTTEERLKFDQVLLVKPGTPSIEIVLPKRAS